jgi:hypothetical protein
MRMTMEDEGMIIELLRKLNGIFTRYVYFEDCSYYPVSSIYVLLTYFYDIFDEIPYLSVSGLLGSGKSRLGDIFQGTCFNPTFSSDYTPASLYRIIDKGGLTLIIDEAEALSYLKRDILPNILRSGYRRNGKVIRCDHCEPREFSTFSPKIIINEGGLVNKALESRTIPIPMIRSRNHLERFRSIRAEVEFREIKHLIGHFTESFRSIISDRYSSFQGVEGLTNRDEEVWTPIIIIAEMLDSMLAQSAIRNQIVGLARRIVEQRRRRQLTDNRDAQILEATSAFVSETEPLHQNGDDLYVGDQLTRFIKDRWNISDLKLEQVSRTLNRYGIINNTFRPRLRIRGDDPIQKSCYSLDRERLSRLTEEYFEGGHDELPSEI